MRQAQGRSTALGFVVPALRSRSGLREVNPAEQGMVPKRWVGHSSTSRFREPATCSLVLGEHLRKPADIFKPDMQPRNSEHEFVRIT
jgi:hypothetical protein